MVKSEEVLTRSSSVEGVEAQTLSSVEGGNPWDKLDGDQRMSW